MPNLREAVVELSSDSYESYGEAAIKNSLIAFALVAILLGFGATPAAIAQQDGESNRNFTALQSRLSFLSP